MCSKDSRNIRVKQLSCNVIMIAMKKSGAGLPIVVELGLKDKFIKNVNSNSQVVSQLGIKT